MTEQIKAPLTLETTLTQAQRAGDLWNTQVSKKAALAYTEASTRRNRNGVMQGRVVVEAEQERERVYGESRSLKEQLEQQRDDLHEDTSVNTSFGGIIGESKALKRTLSKVKAVASTPASVLILGESGVGKEMIARAIHEHSDRAEGRLVKVNCASIPKELFESEFFGHLKGSFTGAHRDRVGRMQLAHKGTLFLDEVGEIPLDLQGKLLRALQENEFERVGDEKTQKVDVRVVAATNRDLAEEVKRGRFREDLYYRLSVFPIKVPPLRARAADIPPLARHFLDLTCQQMGRDQFKLSRSHVHQLKQHSWPGNIRELKNVIERAVILTTGGHPLRLDLALPESAGVQNETVADWQEGEVLTEDEFRCLEKANLTKAMRKTGWKIAGPGGAAELLGLKASTLAYRLSQYGIRKEVLRSSEG